MKGFARTLSVALAVLWTFVATASPRKNLGLADVLKPGAFGGSQPRQVKWMPDGKAFCYFDPGPPGEAGDLMACDAATLKRRVLLAQTAFREAYGKISGVKGDALSKAAFHSYTFSPQGRFLVLPLPDGVYLWELETSSPRRITFEAERAETITFSPDEARGFVYLLGNRENPIGCQVLRADLKGKAVVLVSPAEGWQTATMSPGATWYLDSASGALSPDVLSLVSAKLRPLLERAFPCTLPS